jgi:hypothetical protein
MLLDAMNELKSNPNINLVIAGEFYEDKQPYLDLIKKIWNRKSGYFTW